MVSKASDDLPDPDRPVNTTSLSRGIARSTFLRLCSRAPRTTMARPPNKASTEAPALAACSDDMGFAKDPRYNSHASSANRACGREAPMLEQKKNMGKAPTARPPVLSNVGATGLLPKRQPRRSVDKCDCPAFGRRA